MLSLRDIGSSTASQNDPGSQVGDILAIIDSRTYNKVRKEEGVNPLLFTNVQDPDAIGTRRLAEIDDIFDRSEAKVAADSSSEEGPENETPEERKLRIRLRDQERALRRGLKTGVDATADVDIDAI